MLIVTIGGLIIVASLIGIISGAFDSKVEELRKGRSRVLENDHTLILGWSSKVFPIVNELVHRQRVARQERHRHPRRPRQGRDGGRDPARRSAQHRQDEDHRALRRPDEPHRARGRAARTPRAASSCSRPRTTTTPTRSSSRPRSRSPTTRTARTASTTSSASCRIRSNLEAAPPGRPATRPTGCSPNDLISRITVQTCRQSGLSVVYSELLDFDGDEIYFTEQPTLVGKTLLRRAARVRRLDRSWASSRTARRCSTRRPTRSRGRRPAHRHRRRRRRDQARARRARADGSAVSGAQAAGRASRDDPRARLQRSLHAMLARARRVLDAAVDASRSWPTWTSRSFRRSTNLDVDLRSAATPPAGPCSTRSTRSTFDHIIVLADKRRSPAQRADAKTLITLLHLRDIAERARHRPQRRQRDARRPQPRARRGHPGRRLHRQRQADQPDAVAGVSENKQLTEVFDELFSSERRRDLPAPRRAVRDAGRRAPTSTRCSRRPAARARPRSATGSTRTARSAEHFYGVVREPDQDRIAHVRAGRQDHRARGGLSRVSILAWPCSPSAASTRRLPEERSRVRVVRRLRLPTQARRTAASRSRSPTATRTRTSCARSSRAASPGRRDGDLAAQHRAGAGRRAHPGAAVHRSAGERRGRQRSRAGSSRSSTRTPPHRGSRQQAADPGEDRAEEGRLPRHAAHRQDPLSGLSGAKELIPGH